MVAKKGRMNISMTDTWIDGQLKKEQRKTVRQKRGAERSKEALSLYYNSFDMQGVIDKFIACSSFLSKVKVSVQICFLCLGP